MKNSRWTHARSHFLQLAQGYSVVHAAHVFSLLVIFRHCDLWQKEKERIRHKHARSRIYHSSESFHFSDSVHSSDSFEWTGANTRLLAERTIRTNTLRRYIRLLVSSPDPESLETSEWRFELPACSAIAPSAPYRTPESDINQKNEH